MALQTMRGIEGLYSYVNSAVTGLLLSATAASNKQAFVCRAPKSGNISKIHVRLSTVTSAADVTLSLQNVDATTGVPDGTLDQTGTIASGSQTSNSWQSVTLGSSRAVTIGDVFAVVLEFASTAGSLNIASASTVENFNAYSASFASSTWSKPGRAPLMVLEYDDGSFDYSLGVVAGVPTTVDFGSTSAGADEYGVTLQYPFPVTIIGASWNGRCGGDASLVLQSGALSGTTDQRSVAIDKDVIGSLTGQPIGGLFAAPYTLAANTQYVLSVRPTTATTVRLNYFDCLAANHLDQLSGGGGVGRNFHMAKRIDLGAWTEVTTQRPIIIPILGGADDGAGGGTTPPNTVRQGGI